MLIYWRWGWVKWFDFGRGGPRYSGGGQHNP